MQEEEEVKIISENVRGGKSKWEQKLWRKGNAQRKKCIKIEH